MKSKELYQSLVKIIESKIESKSEYKRSVIRFREILIKNPGFNINHTMNETITEDKYLSKSSVITKLTHTTSLLHKAILENKIEIARILVYFGCDMNLPYKKKEISSTEYPEPEYGKTPVPIPLNTAGCVYTSSPVDLAYKNYAFDVFLFLTSKGAVSTLNLTEKDELIVLKRKFEASEINNKNLIFFSEENNKNNLIKLQREIVGFLGKRKLKMIYNKTFQNKASEEFLEHKIKLTILSEKYYEEEIITLAKKRKYNEIIELTATQRDKPAHESLKKIAILKQNAKNQHEKKEVFLLVGEGNFSFASSLIKQRHKKSKPFIKIISSDYMSIEESQNLHKDVYLANKKRIEKKEGIVLGNVDATQLHSDKSITPYHCKRIYFNNPHDGNSYDKKTLKHIVYGFFSSAKNIQENGDEIHMLLPKTGKKNTDEFREAAYQIYKAAQENGYQYLKKIGNIDTRFPGYMHTKTKESKQVEPPENFREHVFLRTNYSPEFLFWQVPPKPEKKNVGGENIDLLPEKATLPASMSPIKNQNNKQNINN